jgi:hypothetical protein
MANASVPIVVVLALGLLFSGEALYRVYHHSSACPLTLASLVHNCRGVAGKVMHALAFWGWFVATLGRIALAARAQLNSVQRLFTLTYLTDVSGVSVTRVTPLAPQLQLGTPQRAQAPMRPSVGPPLATRAALYLQANDAWPGIFDAVQISPSVLYGVLGWVVLTVVSLVAGEIKKLLLS